MIQDILGDGMNEQDELTSLRKQHDELSRKIDDMQQNPASDQFSLTDLKKQKLKIKERIHRLEG